MKVFFYTTKYHLDFTLHFIKYLSQKVDLYVFVEFADELSGNNLLGINSKNISAGIVPIQEIMDNNLKAYWQEYWKDTKSFNLVLHKHKRSIHLKTWLTSRKVIKIIRDIKPDIVHVDGDSLRLAIGLIGVKHLPIVMDIHDTEAHTGEKNWRRDLARLITFKKSKYFIIFNNIQIEDFCKKYDISSKRVGSIKLGIPEFYDKMMNNNIEEEEKTILFFGRISPYKGLETLLNSMQIVANKISGVKLIIAGRPIKGYSIPEIPFLENQCKIEVINKYISNEELSIIFQKSKIVVCPYTDATQSGVILTAYAFNKPVLVTRVGGLQEYVYDGKTGYIVPPRDPNALAQKIIEMLTHKDKLDEMKKNIQQMKREELNWDKIANNIVYIYNFLIKQNMSKYY